MTLAIYTANLPNQFRPSPNSSWDPQSLECKAMGFKVPRLLLVAAMALTNNRPVVRAEPQLKSKHRTSDLTYTAFSTA